MPSGLAVDQFCLFKGLDQVSATSGLISDLPLETRVSQFDVEHCTPSMAYTRIVTSRRLTQNDIAGVVVGDVYKAYKTLDAANDALLEWRDAFQMAGWMNQATYLVHRTLVPQGQTPDSLDVLPETFKMRLTRAEQELIRWLPPVKGGLLQVISSIGAELSSSKLTETSAIRCDLARVWLATRLLSRDTIPDPIATGVRATIQSITEAIPTKYPSYSALASKAVQLILDGKVRSLKRLNELLDSVGTRADKEERISSLRLDGTPRKRSQMVRRVE